MGALNEYGRMFFIHSQRLKPLPLDHGLLELQQTQGRTALENRLGLRPSNIEMDDVYRYELEEALGVWLKGTAEKPEQYAWITNWEIILEEENMAIGGIGIAGPPDEKGEVMVGYMIDRKYQGKGYASEALTRLAEWIFSHPEVNVIRADTEEDNLPSQKVLERSGFTLLAKENKLYHWGLFRP